ncbi:hypothetical protein FH603_5218 [Spirosoma sp. LMG 31447]|uniref:Uncharacterized protein n=1 Tax=Spirosoma utsteinense TaxID=2585773 RepID=A0ABR6WDQ2_9BACT|nr:hypothetical protein [Spirosoma utsteinense]
MVKNTQKTARPGWGGLLKFVKDGNYRKRTDV